MSVIAVLAVVGTLILASTADARLAVAAVTHRTAEARLEWVARGCLADARATIDAELGAAREGPARDLVWRSLDGVLESLGRESPCAIRAEPFGVRADANALDSAALVRLFSEALGASAAEAAASAVLDWRDADDSPRAAGAERDWYAEHGRYGPTNAPFATDDEIALVRGFENRPDVARFLTSERDLVSLTLAPAAVLAAAAGDDPLVLQLLLEARRSTPPGRDLRDLLSARDTSVARRAAAQYGILAARIVVEPTSWRLTARARDASTGVDVTVEQRLRRTLSHVVVSSERVR